MSKKKRKGGGVGMPFTKGKTLPWQLTGRALEDTQPGIKKRYPAHLLRQACTNEGKRHPSLLPGVSLRPQPPPSEPPVATTTDSCNDIVDLQLLAHAQTDASKDHHSYILSRRRPSTRHVPTLKMEKVANRGFGVTVCFRCSGCQFRSSDYKLYYTTESGACVTNLQAGVALSKIPIKSQDAAFFMASLNVNGPAPKTMQRHFSDSCSVAPEVLDDSLADNRGELRDYVTIVGRNDNPACPSGKVAIDGQFNRPVYHSYDGKSTSVSEPVIEQETGLNKLVGHAVISKLVGSYAKDKVHLNSVLCAPCVYIFLGLNNPISQNSFFL